MEKKKEICFECGFPQSYPIKHQHNKKTKKEKVIITVRDGVAQVEQKPKNIIVQIIDYDYLGDDSRLVPCPLSTDKDLKCCVVTEYK